MVNLQIQQIKITMTTKKDDLIAKLLSEPLYIDKNSLATVLMSNPLDLNISENVSEKTQEYISDTKRFSIVEKVKGEQIGRYTKLQENGIAVMQLHGPVIKDINWDFLYEIYGRFADGIKVIDANIVINELDNLRKNSDVKGLVIDVNSPGGMVVGTPEMGEAIREVRKEKPIVSSVSTMAASAGYWLASQTGYIVASPSSRVGSIGVFLALLDDSGLMEKMGLKLEVIKAGKLKAIGLGKLEDEQREFLQAGVDQMHIEFKEAVEDGMGLNTDVSLMEGQAVVAKDAVNKLVNEVNTNPLNAAIELLKTFI